MSLGLALGGGGGAGGGTVSAGVGVAIRAGGTTVVMVRMAAVVCGGGVVAKRLKDVLLEGVGSEIKLEKCVMALRVIVLKGLTLMLSSPSLWPLRASRCERHVPH